MPHIALLAAALFVAGPALAEPIKPVSGLAPAPLIDPITLKVNEAAAKRLDADQKARDQTWDAKLKQTMVSVCRGC